MNTQFNTILKQSTSIRRDLSNLSPYSPSADPSQPPNLTPAAVGSLSASLTSFSRSIDEYNRLIKEEPNPTKQEKALERIKNFRSELAEYRSQFDNLKSSREEAVHTQNRSELLGRRPFATSTPENPYANATSSGSHSYGGPGGLGHARTASAGERGHGAAEVTREDHAFREAKFFESTHKTLDEYLARGSQVLGDLGTQREMLKSTQSKLFTVGNTLGISRDTIKMIDRRAREDKWIFWAGVVIFFLFCWLCLHYLR